MPSWIEAIANWLVTHSEFVAGTLRYVTTMIGAVGTYMLAPSDQHRPTIAAFKRLLPDKREAAYERMNFLFLVVLGSIFGTIVFQPQNSFQALAAGLGWVSAVTTLQNSKLPQNSPAHAPGNLAQPHAEPTDKEA